VVPQKAQFGAQALHFIDNEVITACLTFEEDIGHLLIQEAAQLQSELGKTSCWLFLAAIIAYVN
jgi:hypothetical protein